MSHRQHPNEPHPFECELRSEPNHEIQAEIRAERYCQCDLDLTEDEWATGKCAACGKEIEL